jgi:MipA family protein
LSAGLRVDNGRKSGDSGNLAGLPDIRRTLRGRVAASWQPLPRWALSASAQSDLLGRQGGTTLSAGIGHSIPISERQRVGLSAGATLGDATYMNSYFGIDPTAAAASNRRPFVPGAGLRDVGVGASHNLRVSQRWFVMTTVSAARLQGDAAISPVTQKRNQFGASFSVAYQCCR